MTLQDYLDNEIKQGIKKGIAEELEIAKSKVIAEAMAEVKAEAIAEAKAEAIAEAKAEAITEVVEMLKELNIPDEQIEEKIMEKYQLSGEEAKSYLN